MKTSYPFIFSIAMVMASPGFATTVEELARSMARNDAPAIIDLRPTTAYQKGHIPGAISVPMPVLEDRSLPPLGEVVAYGDGFGRQNIKAAGDILNAKNGISAEILEGGYAAWQSRSGVTTAGAGMEPQRPSTISYQTLQKASSDEVVVYDLRQEGENPPEAQSSGGESTSEQLGGGLRVEDHFPQVEVRRSNPLRDVDPVAVTATLPEQNRTGENQPERSVAEGGQNHDEDILLKDSGQDESRLIVLVDNDNESAEEVARKLRASGHRRVAVLAGGETILRFSGKSGSLRVSGGSIERPFSESGEEGASE